MRGIFMDTVTGICKSYGRACDLAGCECMSQFSEDMRRGLVSKFMSFAESESLVGLLERVCGDDLHRLSSFLKNTEYGYGFSEEYLKSSVEKLWEAIDEGRPLESVAVLKGVGKAFRYMVYDGSGAGAVRGFFEGRLREDSRCHPVYSNEETGETVVILPGMYAVKVDTGEGFDYVFMDKRNFEIFFEI